VFVFIVLLLVWAWKADAQECCPVSDALSEPLPLLSPRTTEPLPYQFNVYPSPVGAYPIYPYNPVYRGRLYEFTGTILNGVPIYRQIP
jgi:hypothetical protein